MSKEANLPPCWTLATIDQIFARLQDGRLIHQGWSPQCEKQPSISEENWGVLKTTAIQLGAFWPHANKELPSHLPARPQIEVHAGDLLLTCAGPRSRCGIACLVKSTRPRLMLSGKMYRFRVPSEHIEARYIEHFLQSAKAQVSIDAMKTGGNDSGLNLTHDRFKTLELPIAPQDEQKRIASKIDELFSSIDEGERALGRVRKLVERYRQSVLKAAVTGELTREWREQHVGELESGEALLTRILEARRQTWEQSELAKMQAKGIRPTIDGWKTKYEVPQGPEKDTLANLPDGWAWSSLGQLFQVHGGSTPSRKRPEYWNGNIPWVSSGEVAFCRIHKTEECISTAGYDNSSVKLHPAGTVLLAMIGEGKTRGQAAILSIPACHNQNAASIRVSGTPIPPEYIYHLLKLRYEQTRAVGQGGNQPALNGEIVKSITVPLPPLAELTRICEVIESQMASLDAIEASIAPQRRLIEAQRQTILREAFAGQLVPQDPTDEPASALLERIAAERAAAPKRTAAKATRTKKTKSKIKP